MFCYNQKEKVWMINISEEKEKEEEVPENFNVLCNNSTFNSFPKL